MATAAPSGAKQRLVALLRERSFERRRVVLASGKESDFFIDCKQTVLSAEGHALAGEVLFDALGELPACDAIAGVELGGCPLASAVSFLSYQRGRPLPALYVRKQAKDHGSRRLVEGGTALGQGARAVLLEDVVTTGGSSLRAVEALRQSGIEVVGVAALVDRLEGGAEAIRAAGLALWALSDRRDYLGDELERPESRSGVLSRPAWPRRLPGPRARRRVPRALPPAARNTGGGKARGPPFSYKNKNRAPPAWAGGRGAWAADGPKPAVTESCL